MTTESLLCKANQSLAGFTLLVAFVTAAPVAHAQSNDAQLQQSVTAAIAKDPTIANKGITTSVSGGVVTITGNVATEDIRNDAETVVAGVTGVSSIQDNLNVGDPSQASAAPAAGSTPPPPPDDQDATQGNGSQPGSAQAAAPAANANMAAPAQNNGTNGNMPPPPPSDEANTAPGNSGYPPAGGYEGGYGQGAPGGDWGTRGNAHVPGGPANLLAVAPQQQDASGPVTLPPGTLVSVRTTQPLSTQNLKGGEFFQVTAAANVYQNGVVAIPRGTILNGQVIKAKNAGAFGGRPQLDVKLTSLQLGPNNYPIASDDWDSNGPSKTGYTAANTVGGAAFGALIGAIAGGGVGAGIGAAAGGATGYAVSGAARGPHLVLPPETLLQFHVLQPITVQPLKFQVAEQVAASAPQVPQLQQRPAYPPPNPYYVQPYPYGAPPPPPAY